MAYVVGTLLLVLVLAGVPLKHFGHNASVVSVVGPLHGFLYIGYLICAFDLAYRRRWQLGWTLVMLLAGTIPFLTFIVERMVTRRIRDEAPATTAAR